MRTLYLVSVYLHIVAAIIWVGGMLFLTLIIVPWMRGAGRASGSAFLRESGRRFRDIGWISFAVLAATGTFNLSMRGVGLASFGDSRWMASAFSSVVLSKLGVFALVLLLSALHDFWLGPSAAAAIERDPRSTLAQRLRRRASYIGRMNLVLGLAVVLLGVLIVRGVP